jgi:Helix-turn-helix domain
MGRREVPLDPDHDAVQRFAHDLRRLREAAGSPSYRWLATRAHYSPSALSTAARGKILPSWEVTRAFVLACDGDEREWRRRWEETSARAPGAPDQPGTGAAPEDRPAGHRRHRTWWALAGVPVLAAALTAGIAAGPSWNRAAGRGTRKIETPVELGHDCAPQGVIAPAASGTAPGAPRLRMGFEPGGRVWGPYWNEKNIHERLVREQPYQGSTALEVRVGPGLGAVGTTHVAGLRPEATLRLHVWYGGQGQGMICPFAQDPNYTIQWVPVAPLRLTPATHPGWRTYQWVMPEMAVHGVGVQLTNTGVSDMIVLLDAVEW